MDAGDHEIANALGAYRLNDELWALATEYQKVVKPGRDRRDSDRSKEARARLDPTMIKGLYQMLQPRSVIDSMRQHGLTEIADRLDDLREATEITLSHADTDDGVETLAIDVQALHQAVEQAVWSYRTMNWTQVDHIGNLRGIDNAGLLDELDDSFLNTLSKNEFCALYDAVEHFSTDRALAWQNEGDRAATVSKTWALSRLMYRAGKPASAIAETLRASLGCSQTTLIKAMSSAGITDSAITEALGVSQERIDESLWRSERTDSSNDAVTESEGESDDVEADATVRHEHTGTGIETGSEATYTDDYPWDADEPDERIEVDPIDQLFQLGHVFYNVGDLPEALAWYTRAAEAGHIGAMVQLGALLVTDCDPPDLPAARTWDEKAANSGSVMAMYNLGVLLQTLIEPPDLLAARAWYAKAADAGHTDAMFNLAIICERCVPPDLSGARAWYEKAADAGSTEAITRLGWLLAEQWDPPDFAAAHTWFEKAADAGEKKARAWVIASYEQSADAGDTEAMKKLADLLAKSIPSDLSAAQAWYKKAADAGHLAAMNNLANLLVDSSPPDLAAARIWYERAANAGLLTAMYNLGQLLENEWDPPDRLAARQWYEKAANAGDTDAMTQLGILLAQSDPPDLTAARAWLEQASDKGNRNAAAELANLSEHPQSEG